jgi:hypothetical protein
MALALTRGVLLAPTAPADLTWHREETKMSQLKRCVPLFVCLVSIGGAAGVLQTLEQVRQRPAKPPVSAAQVLDRFVEATGGRAAYSRLTSSFTSITVTAWAESISSGKRERIDLGKHTVEIYAKAPNRRLSVIKTPGEKDGREGYDGKMGWIDQGGRTGAVELASKVMPQRRREAAFNAPLRWRELYEKAELIGVRQVDNRDAYAIRLTPALEKPIVHYYDTRTFLLLRIDEMGETPVGTAPTESYLSDYRVVDGVKMPFVLRARQRLPKGIAEFRLTVTRIQTNVPIDDNLFARPAARSPR